MNFIHSFSSSIHAAKCYFAPTAKAMFSQGDIVPKTTIVLVIKRIAKTVVFLLRLDIRGKVVGVELLIQLKDIKLVARFPTSEQ